MFFIISSLTAIPSLFLLIVMTQVIGPTVPAIILYESFLSYLGLGIQPPMASWGLLINEGAEQINPIRIYWWLIVSKLCRYLLLISNWLVRLLVTATKVSS
jgi:ABC-type dipeptide/oligopeptide/nickel transport system permease subunit